MSRESEREDRTRLEEGIGRQRSHIGREPSKIKYKERMNKRIGLSKEEFFRTKPGSMLART